MKAASVTTIAPELLALAERAKCICEAQPKTYVQAAADVHAILMAEAMTAEQEILWILVLNTRNRLIEKVELYRGSLNTSMVRIAEVFKRAIVLNAASIIVAHNHPSGDATPSPEDIALTRAMVAAGKLLDIEVLDHVIVGHGTYTSLKTKGLGFDA